MIKECVVLSRNCEVMVIQFGDTQVQMPSDNETCETVFIELKDGCFETTNRDKFEKSKEQATKNKVENGEKVVTKQLR